MRCTASAATSTDPTTRPIGSVARSWLRLLSSWSPSSDADKGVSTKPAAMRLTRTGASSTARLAASAGSAAVSAETIGPPTPGRRASVPLINSSVPPGPHLAGRLARDVEREPEMLVDLAVGSGEVDVGQARVVGAAGGDHHVVDRGRKVLEKPREAIRIGGVEGGAAQGAELARGVLQAPGIAAGDDDLGPFG